MGIRQREWFSPSWWGKPVFNFLVHKMEMKITLVLVPSQVLYETRMKGYCINTLEIINYCTNISYYCGYCIVCLLIVLFAPGLIEHEGRDVVIALKTRQAIRNVIAKALKNLTFLWSRGIIDKHEGVEMNKVIKKLSIFLDCMRPTPKPALFL